MIRGAGALVIFFMLLLVIFAGVAVGTAYMAPARLFIPQERMLGVMRGGVVNETENSVLGDCGGSPPLAVPRNERVVQFADGSSLVIVVYNTPVLCTP